MALQLGMARSTPDSAELPNLHGFACVPPTRQPCIRNREEAAAQPPALEGRVPVAECGMTAKPQNTPLEPNWPRQEIRMQTHGLCKCVAWRNKLPRKTLHTYTKVQPCKIIQEASVPAIQTMESDTNKSMGVFFESRLRWQVRLSTPFEEVNTEMNSLPTLWPRRSRALAKPSRRAAEPDGNCRRPRRST